MPLTTGTRLGLYEIVAPLGAGGMGEVYRARDTRLGREVAIKVVLEAFLADRERLIRFEREAKSLAALNHPNIATLLGMEEADGRHFLVMELVDGETLGEKLARAPLSLEHAISTARQIADALEAAHEKGIVHRDLKPANIKITPDDKVKVLDFGLAKAADADPGSPNMSLANSPTVSAMATQAGIILGTASYMSPEQARGMAADHRADIFSFGVVLYEMLTGRQPFQGETVSDVLASVLAREPDLGSLPPDIAPRLTELLNRCLQKQPKRRWQAIGDVRHELEIISGAPRHVPVTQTTMMPAAPPRPWWRRALPIAAAVIVTAAASGGAVWLARPKEPGRVVSRFVIPFGEGQERTLTNSQGLAIAPDGTSIAYVANAQIYVRAIGDLDARLLTRTGAVLGISPRELAFSPDGRSIAYAEPEGDKFAIKRIEITGGAPVTVAAETATALLLDWRGDSIVVLATTSGGGPGSISRVAASGGQPERIIQLEQGEVASRPQMLDDGRVLYAVGPAQASGVDWSKGRIVVQRPGEKVRTTIVEGGTDPRYLSSGHLIYQLNGVLYARTFDPSRLAAGGAVSVVEGVLRGVGGNNAWYAVSDSGTLVYLPGAVSTGGSGELTPALFDRAGKAEPFQVPAGPYSEPRMSPDGRRIAFGSSDARDTSIWVYDLAAGGSARRLTFGGHDRFPVWSSDSQRVIFQSDREGDLGLFWQRADGVGTAERLTQPGKGIEHVPQSASPDGKVLLVDQTEGAKTALMTFAFKDKSMTPFGAIVSTHRTGAIFSPDGRWVAYTMGEPGASRDILSVQPFPATGSRVQISTNAETGHHPVWSSDGKELYYNPGPGGRLVAVTVMASQGFAFGPAPPVAKPFASNSGLVERTYDVARDGKRFLGLMSAGVTATGSSRTELRVVLNLFDELKARAPVKK
jgi:Tol biopolymer transport system component/predicted Ser/Thr protein kinase